MPKTPREHADNFDLRDPDFRDNDLLYDVYSIMRERAPFVHTDTPFLSIPPDGAWVSTRYEESYQVLRDWQHFSNEMKSETNANSQMFRDAVIVWILRGNRSSERCSTIFFASAHEGAGEQVRVVTDRLIDEFIESGNGDLAFVAWRQPGIVFFQYVLGMPVEEVPQYLDIIDESVNGIDAESRLAASISLYEHMRDEVAALPGAVTTRRHDQSAARHDDRWRAAFV